MSRINVYKVKLTKTFDIEMEASSPDEAIEQARQLCNDDGKCVEEIECEEIITGYFCPVCGSTLRYEFMTKERKILNKVYSCMNDSCALDWTISEDIENGKFLKIQKYFFG